ncbi:V-type ATP synthase subunit I [Labilibacter marinus]|uniref:V-type ATP synthase subunit I n=1 Tax=Labilibacter marinus TaxID=1477105 RepID=UPI0013019101|nr:V-type ATPase 116kDa subunit family protein [Labilibacter marinus]
MKKFSLLIYHAEYANILDKLRSLGVLHVEMGESELSTENSAKLTKINHLKGLMQEMDSRRSEDEVEPIITDGDELIKLIEDNNHEDNRLTQEIFSLEKEKESISPWGNFNPESIEGIKNAGYQIQFLICDEKNWDEQWRDVADIELVNQENGEMFMLAISKGDKLSHANLDEVKLEQPLSYFEKLIQDKKDELAKVEKQLDDLSLYANKVLKQSISQLQTEIDYSKVYGSGEKVVDDKLVVLSGWVPTKGHEDFEKELETEAVVYTMDAPTPEDSMPIKLKNSKFARLFESIGELYTLPNHKELDLTPFFAPFYMLFFGFCLGDAGYGLLIVLGTLFGLTKAKPKVKPLLWLGFFLGVSTTIMGILGGTFFGVMFGLDADGQPLQHVAWLHNYQQWVLNTDNLMILSLVLGYIQVIFGMILKSVNLARVYGFKYSISQIGWTIIVAIAIPAYGLGMQEMIDAGLANQIAIAAAVIGGIPALLYNSPGKNILLNFGTGLWDTYGMASGLLGDVLSYIRLFALGLSSAILGSVFNSLAMDLSPDTIILRQLVMVLILAFGHSLNIFMALLGSFVHPLRLTFVEFYKNAGFEGGGHKYEPFSSK